jgi:hypothetical protein
MFTKRSTIVILVGLNLLLLAAILLPSYSLPAAHAQMRSRTGDYACVTAKAATQTYDVLYVLDVPSRKLYAFYPTAAGRRGSLTAAPPRDLVEDFERDTKGNP